MAREEIISMREWLAGIVLKNLSKIAWSLPMGRGKKGYFWYNIRWLVLIRGLLVQLDNIGGIGLRSEWAMRKYRAAAQFPLNNSLWGKSGTMTVNRSWQCTEAYLDPVNTAQEMLREVKSVFNHTEDGHFIVLKGKPRGSRRAFR